jgi:hypothetical protein
MERKRVLNPKYSCQLVTRVLKKILEMLENQCKGRISTRALGEPKHKFSTYRCGGSAFSPRGSVVWRFPEVPCFSQRHRGLEILEGSAFFVEAPRYPETAARTKEERVKTRSKQLGLI